MTNVTTPEQAAYIRRAVGLGCAPNVAAKRAEFLKKKPEERERAMWNGELTLDQLAWWSANHPDEVPKINDEFAWIAITTPEYCEGR